DSERDRVRFLIHTGLRKSEFANLRWKNVDLRASVITIPRSKNGETRHVPMTSMVRATLGRMPRPIDPSALVFPRSVGATHTHWAEKAFPEAVRAARIQDFRSRRASRWKVWTCSRSKIWGDGRPCRWSSDTLTYPRVIDITRSSAWPRGRLNGN